MRPLRIGIIGDFAGDNPTHVATNAALTHAAEALDVSIDVQWLGTQPYEKASQVATLGSWDGLWGAPGSPYVSRHGAFHAIRFARERHRPFVGT